MLNVIGAGLGRTGTNSFKLAMEILGFGKCHHMVEVLDHPDHAPVFLAAAQGEAVDWDALFDGYQSSTDWPSCHFWRELSEHFPQAKIVLTVRDAESWYRSMSETILPTMKLKFETIQSPIVAMGDEILMKQFLQGNADDKDHVIAMFERHNQTVRDAIPDDRLLEFKAQDGWEPLCAFLGVPVPDEPYPVTNSLDEFQEKADRVV